VSKVKLHIIIVILTLLAQASLLSAENTFVETNSIDPAWVLVTSDSILRANLCVPDRVYEKVFNPCYGDAYNRYWELALGARTGRAFPMEAIKRGSLDSFYVSEGFGFQLYNGTTGEPCSPYLGGAKYVSLTCWRNAYGFERGTFFVPGDQGELANYSIIVCRYPLRLHKTHNAPPDGVKQEDYVTYEISYENQPEGLRDPTDPNSGPQDTNNVIITDFLPLEMDFNSASNGGVYNPRFHTVTWNIGDLSIGDSGSVHLNVRVNRRAEPGGIITNYSEIVSGSLCAAAAVDVNVLYKPSIMTLTKVDTNAPNPVLPGNFITYGITYGPNSQSHSNVRLVDYLPPEVNFTNPSDQNYNPVNHSYTWSIGSVSAGASPASVTLIVRVNYLAEPNGVIINHCKIESDSSYTAATAETSVSPWQPNVIYVDNMAKRGSNTGMSWANAYLDLQDALERAASGYGSQIWVAEGIYKPTTNPGNYVATFELINGVALYGGFAGTETSLSQRNWLTNQTTLTGDVTDDGQSDMHYVVTASDVNETAIIDGFTITMGYYAALRCDVGGSPIIQHNRIIKNGRVTEKHGGIFCNNGSSPTIADCSIQNNSDYGIYSYKSDPNIINCIIKDNSEDGICHYTASLYDPAGGLTVSNCIIENNNGNGIYNENSLSAIIANNIIRNNGGYGIHYYWIWQGMTAEIKNNWIYSNGSRGIYIELVDEPVKIRNNTIANNAVYGISLSLSSAPNIRNCIIWGNDAGQLQGCTAAYSCIQNWVSGGEYNINIDPCFVGIDVNNYHLEPNSPCIDKGDPNFTDSNETDIDGEPRILDGDANNTDIVDMGADEFYWSPADFDRNEIVNFIDYAVLASAWLTDEPNISLDDDNDVDMNDLARFCDDWLWQPAWKQSDPLKMMGAGYGQSAAFAEALSTAAPPQQPQTELQPESEPQLQVQSTPELPQPEPELQPEPQPQPQYEPSHTTQELIDWLEGVLEDEQIKNTPTEDSVRKIIESLKEEL
jgi:parallel beta-helix repeat protein